MAKARRAETDGQLPAERLQILPTRSHFEQASLWSPRSKWRPSYRAVTIRTRTRGPHAFVNAEFDIVFVVQIGKDQQGFFDVYRTKIIADLRS